MPSCFSWISRQLFTSCKGARETGTRRADGGHSGWLAEEKPATSTPPSPTTERCSSGRGTTSLRFFPLNQQVSTDSGGHLFDPQPIRDPEYHVAKSASNSSVLEATRTFPSGSRPIASGETLPPPSLDSATDFGHGPASDGRGTSNEQDQRSPWAAPRVLDMAPVPTGREHHAVSRWNSQGHPSMATTAVPTGYFAQSTHIPTTNFGLAKTLFEHLNPYIAPGAAHNSDERRTAPACDAGTRVDVREDIVEWVKHGNADQVPKIMWLSGPAGAGKSAIAGSVAETCKKEGLLAASFFFSSFSGSSDSCSKRCVITTIASHLAAHEALRDFTGQLHTSIRRDPSILSKSLKEQAVSLLLRPLRTIRDCCDITDWPKVIIIDGLDEVEAHQYCAVGEYDSVQREILDALFTLAADANFPFRIFISSRRERSIQEYFSNTSHALELPLDSKYNPNPDIRRFLEAKFAAIRRRDGISNPSWPGRRALDRLVDMSSGQFMLPATVIRYVEAGVPQRQLDSVLHLSQLDSEGGPFASLDALYHHILNCAHNPDNDPHMVVKWILSIRFALGPRTLGGPPPAKFWRQLLEDVDGELSYRLGPVSSLITVPQADNTSAPITIYHKSFTDFLSAKTRCGDLYVDDTELHSFVASRIVAVLKHKGPVVSFVSPGHDFFKFLQYFRYLKLLAPAGSAPSSPDALILEHYSRFLVFLGENSKHELASCDVSFWTDVLLAQTLFRDGSSYVFSPGDDGMKLLGSIYCGIHKAMKCDGGTDSSIPSPSITWHTERDGAPQAHCHVACFGWRAGILSRVKKLNWCVHDLEQVEPNLLHDVTIGELKHKFRRVRSGSPCAICQHGMSGTPNGHPTIAFPNTWKESAVQTPQPNHGHNELYTPVS